MPFSFGNQRISFFPLPYFFFFVFLFSHIHSHSIQRTTSLDQTTFLINTTHTFTGCHRTHPLQTKQSNQAKPKPKPTQQIMSSFRQGSIFYDMLAPEAALNPAQKATITAPSLESKALSVSLLASPPPSPSRNSIFNQSWSTSTRPNVSSLRPRSDSTASATSTSSFTDQHPRSSPRFGATDTEGSYSTKFYHHSNNSSQSNLRSNKSVTALQEGTNTSSSNGPSENNRKHSFFTLHMMCSFN